MNLTPSRDGMRVNERISALNVRLIDETGENVGVVTKIDAMQRAENAGLDLVEISPGADPPVCKILDYGRYKYVDQKKKAEARKKQKTIDIKEIKMRPNIDQHDYDVKMRAIFRFIDDGDKVKVTMRFRGREMVHQNLGLDVLNRVKAQLEEVAKVEQFPRVEGRQMIMVMAPR
ncbi:MAG: translation initiation factor IF-3 [Alphaproteobacteria bacterium]